MCTLETHETILPTPQVFIRVEVLGEVGLGPVKEEAKQVEVKDHR